MNDSIDRNSGRSALALAIGIVLTFVALAAHRFLPDRRLTLDPARENANFYLTKGEDALSRVDWVDESRLHFKCRFIQEAAGASCGSAPIRSIASTCATPGPRNWSG